MDTAPSELWAELASVLIHFPGQYHTAQFLLTMCFSNCIFSSATLLVFDIPTFQTASILPWLGGTWLQAQTSCGKPNIMHHACWSGHLLLWPQWRHISRCCAPQERHTDPKSHLQTESASPHTVTTIPPYSHVPNLCSGITCKKYLEEKKNRYGKESSIDRLPRPGICRNLHFHPDW